MSFNIIRHRINCYILDVIRKNYNNIHANYEYDNFKLLNKKYVRTI